jgi:hypothetical protein
MDRALALVLAALAASCLGAASAATTCYVDFPIPAGTVANLTGTTTITVMGLQLPAGLTSMSTASGVARLTFPAGAPACARGAARREWRDPVLRASGGLGRACAAGRAPPAGPARAARGVPPPGAPSAQKAASRRVAARGWNGKRGRPVGRLAP